MFAKFDIRKSALTLLAAAALSTVAGVASSAHASALAASARLAVPTMTAQSEYGTEHEAGRNGHRLTRPANRFNGFVGTPGPTTGTRQGP
ncbi:MAG: hypothetical protein FD152_864 [Xanthobacteraceae bacterium]|nr:MAG: hypothetical protein FD152_864 [Xanthobacteraceae bacterium]